MSTKVVRIAGVPLPPNKHIVIGLRSIYGIGRTRAEQVCEKAGVEPAKKGRDLTDQEEESLRQVVRVLQEQGELEGDLRRKIAMNIKRLRDMRTYRGLRHQRSLPARGQRTRTNANTRRRRRGRDSKNMTTA